VNELELYVHIPFCVRKCAYCDFLSFPSKEDLRQEYVNALIREIRGYGKRYASCHVPTVFIGGGTPSILSSTQIQAVFSAIRETFRVDPEAEITMEANPGTVTEEKLLAWKGAGVNRISIGLQSVRDEELRMLGRIHDHRQFLDTWRLVRQAGMENVNIDLISAIPGQTPESWRETLRKTVELAPEHLSVYSLIIEEGTPFYEWYSNGPRDPQSEDRGRGAKKDASQDARDGAQGPADPAGVSGSDDQQYPPLPDEETERLMYEETENILTEYGYARYEISNYAKPGCACRHNIGYWQRKAYLGIGLGSSSLIGTTRFCHTPDMETYLACAGDPGKICEEEQFLSKKDEMEEFMFLGLRMMCGVRKSEFFRLFGIPVDTVYGETLKKLREYGLLEIEKETIRLTKRGIDISNYVFAQFLLS